VRGQKQLEFMPMRAIGGLGWENGTSLNFQVKGASLAAGELGPGLRCMSRKEKTSRGSKAG